MADYIRVRVGRKMTDEDMKKVDLAKAPVEGAAPPTSEVEGQDWYNGWTVCPHCGNVGYTRGLNTDFEVALRCGRWGHGFWAGGPYDRNLN